jgi:TolB-like protein
LPPDLERVVRRCLQKQPDARYNDTRDLVAELRDLQTTGESQAATPVEQQDESKKIPAWIWGAALAILVAALVFLAGPFRQDPEEPQSPEVVAVAEIPSVAVLPFHNLSADEDNAYFSAGITEEIISKLSRIDGLEVASRSSVAAFTDPARDVQQIGRDLGVQYLLDGSVRRAGDQVRVSAQLVDGSTGRNLWSEDFDGNLEDVFAIQEQTALKIAERLDLELSPEEERDVQRQLTENVAAYDAYLRGMSLSRSWGDREVLEQAAKQFELALELDPDFAAAMAGWSFVEGDMYRNFDTSEERIRHAEELAERAVELDPEMPEGSHALGLIAGNRFDYKRASRLLREAVRLDPKESRFWDNLSWSLAYETPPDGDGAVQAAREALRLQPLFPGAYYHLGRGLIAQGKYEEARQAFERSLEQNPDFSSGHLGLAQYHLAIGEWDQALDEIKLSEEKGTAIVAYYSAAVFAGEGDFDQALEALESALELDYRDFANLDASPYFAALREDPRFAELVQRYQG